MLQDIFTYLNELNLSLQGAAVNRFKVEDKTEAIIKNLACGQNALTTVCVSHFQYSTIS